MKYWETCNWGQGRKGNLSWRRRQHEGDGNKLSYISTLNMNISVMPDWSYFSEWLGCVLYIYEMRLGICDVCRCFFVKTSIQGYDYRLLNKKRVPDQTLTELVYSTDLTACTACNSNWKFRSSIREVYGGPIHGQLLLRLFMFALFCCILLSLSFLSHLLWSPVCLYQQHSQL